MIIYLTKYHLLLRDDNMIDKDTNYNKYLQINIFCVNISCIKANAKDGVNEKFKRVYVWWE